MITFFTIPKPFKGHYDIIQKNAVLSWKKIEPKCEILIYGDEKSIINFSKSNELKCIKKFKSNSYGTPLIDDIWDSAKKYSSNDLICYINTDIILLPDFVKLKKLIYPNFLQLVDVGTLTSETIDFNSDWVESIIKDLKKHGKLHGETGVDFLFPKNIMPKMPEFAIGRGWWDNWILHNIKSRSIPLIDATEIISIHQNHDYSHVKSTNKNTNHKGLENKWRKSKSKTLGTYLYYRF